MKYYVETEVPKENKCFLNTMEVEDGTTAEDIKKMYEDGKIVSKNGNPVVFERALPVHESHFCKACGELTAGNDENVLCEACKTLWGCERITDYPVCGEEAE